MVTIFEFSLKDYRSVAQLQSLTVSKGSETVVLESKHNVIMLGNSFMRRAPCGLTDSDVTQKAFQTVTVFSTVKFQLFLGLT